MAAPDLDWLNGLTATYVGWTILPAEETPARWRRNSTSTRRTPGGRGRKL
jgi:hypothetical protein